MFQMCDGEFLLTVNIGDLHFLSDMLLFYAPISLKLAQTWQAECCKQEKTVRES